MNAELTTIFENVYPNTVWGDFYTNYKDATQIQLVKKILETKNELKEIKEKSGFYRMKYAQHIFYHTFWNKELDEWETPYCLLRHNKHSSETKAGYIRKEGTDDYSRWKDEAYPFILTYHRRCLAELKIVEEHYKLRKLELEQEQKVAHKEHANEKVKCPFCGAEFSRTNLARHKRTNKKCLESQKLELEPEEI